MFLLLSFLQSLIFAQPSISCFNQPTKVDYLCDQTCDSEFYYQRNVRLFADMTCLVSEEDFGTFEVWHMCDDLDATYNSYEYTEETRECVIS